MRIEAAAVRCLRAILILVIPTMPALAATAATAHSRAHVVDGHYKATTVVKDSQFACGSLSAGVAAS